MKSKDAARAPQSISFSDLKKLSTQYHDIKGLHIFIAGDVRRDLLIHTQKRFLDEIPAAIAEIKARPFPALHLLAFFRHKFEDDPALRPVKKHIKNIDEASEAVLTRLHKLLEKNNQSIRDRLFKHADTVITEIAHYAAEQGLEEGDAEEELARLAEIEPAVDCGYLYPAKKNRQGHGHAETFLVSSIGQVINLIPFPDPYLQRVPYQYTSQLELLMPAKTDQQLCPMATKSGCGALGLSYLKHYLKDDAKLFREGSLLIDFRDERYTYRFHLPPAQVLKYSQSELYIKAMRAFVASTEATVTVRHKDRDITITTLKGLQASKAKICRPDGNEVTPEQLTIFCEAWLAQCDISEQQRATMQVKKKNQYLTYTSLRLAGQVGEGLAIHTGTA